MYRTIMAQLLNWKKSNSRKPLILKGSRQVGKTYILKEFGHAYYKNLAYFNFDHDDNLANLFLNTKDPKRILEQLSLVCKEKILPQETLIFFDEIQECPNALNSLKYFCEEANEYHVVCAVSLLKIRLSHTSFPVGKVDFLNLYPMTFSEFLIADGCSNLVDYMKSIKNPQKMEDIFLNQLEEKLKIYFIVGGMPEVVKSWVEEKDILKVDEIQKNILLSYESDFAKHISNTEANKVSLIWNGIPSQLSRENKKFVYQVVKEGARAREYENALNWLNDANLITKIYHVKKANFPLKAYQDLSSFKIYMNDVGLLRRMAGLDSKIILDGNQLFEEFKGSFTENYVINMLTATLDSELHYYTFDRYEIDLLIERKNKIIPIEIKASQKKSHLSLTKFNEKNQNDISLVFSMDHLKKDGKVLTIPLCFVEFFQQVLEDEQ